MAGIAVIPWLLFLSPTLIKSQKGCCGIPGNYPYFICDPEIKITVSSPTKVKVSWAFCIGGRNCAKYFFVYYWKSVGGQLNEDQRIFVEPEKDYVEINLEEETVYSVKLHLVEDGVAGTDGVFCTITESKIYNFETKKSGKSDTIMNA